MEMFENDKALLDDFVRLNEQWIATYFEIEDVDRALAANPYQIVEKGGYIFSLVVENKVVGVSALFNEGNGSFELARMAVSPESQGKGYGGELIEACLSKLTEINASRVYLLSNTKLNAVIALYKKHGFNIVFQGEHPAYARANVLMERPIP